MINNFEIGRVGEDKALKKYNEDGFCLVAQNFEYYKKGGQGRVGEIDLIVQKDNLIVMVEVKTRTNNKFGNIAEQVTRTKLLNLYKAYQFFLLKNPQFRDYKWRFDVVTIQNDELKIIKNAYSFDGLF